MQSKSFRARRRAVLMSLAALASSTSLFAADTTWTGPSTGTWNVAANWNNGAPTSGTNTSVDNGAATDVNVIVTASATTGTLNISSGDRVTLNNNVVLSLNGSGTIAMLNNAGRLVIDSGASASQLRFATTTTTGIGTISGGGTITLNGPLAGINGTNPSNAVNLDNYIHGQGNIGGDSLRFDNRGSIVADVGGGTLTIDPDAGGTQFINTGVLRAAGGGILALNTGIFTNAGGTIDAQDGSVVYVLGFASVSGGTITTSGSGKVGVPVSQNGFFTDVVNNGAMFADNGSDFGISSSFVNNGSISLNAGASATDLELQNDTTLSGTGQVIMGGPTAGINGINGSRLTIAAGQTIRGQGSIGQELLRLTNAGVITADVNAGTITIDPDAGGGTIAMINTGTLRAANGGTLVLSTDSYQNAGGTIEALDNSNVLLASFASVFGGSVSSSGSGAIRVPDSQNAFFTDVTFTGLAIGQNNSDFGINGAITNNGTIRIEAGISATDLEIQGDTTLSGNGTVILSGANAGINGIDDRRLTIGAGHTIRGEGRLGQLAIWITNNGLIEADVNGGTLTLTADGTAGSISFINTGTLRAANGGILALSGLEGEFTSSGGTIEAQDGSTVRLHSNARVYGGTYLTSGAGSVRVNDSQNAFFIDFTNNGLMVGENNSDLGISGNVVNNGTIRLEAGVSATDLEIQADTTLSGGGQVILSGALAGVNGVDDRRLTNAAGHVIRGQGALGQLGIWITNNGLIEADVNGATLTLAADGTAGTLSFVNNGTLRATNGATMVLSGLEGEYSGLGTIVADTGSNVIAAASADLVESGPITGGGTFTVTGSSTVIAQHYRVSNVVVSSSTARVAAGGGTLGTSKLDTLTLSGTGRFDLTDHDLALDYAGASPIASVRGQIATAFGTGNWAGAGLTSSLAAAASSTPDKTGLGYAEATDLFGTFPASFGGVSVDGSTVLVRYTLLGDANLDRTVGIADFSRLGANFNTPGTWFNGDFNYDGTVGIGDFSLLASNYNKTLPAAELPRGAAVPEPTCAMLLVVAATLTCVSRRRTG